MFRRGSAVVIAVLVVVAVIPILIFLFVSSRNNFTNNSIASIRSLPADTFTAVVREVREIDKYGKEIRYWVTDTTNHSDTTYYNCYQVMVSKGEQEIFYGFSANYSLRNCNQLGETRSNYECRLSNTITRTRYSNSSRIWDRIAAGGHLVVAVSRYYQEETISSQAFLIRNKLTDIYSLVSICRTPTGQTVKQEMIAPRLIPL